MNVKGFKVNFLGDSITEGVGVVDRANCRYDKRLEKMCELSKVNNYGISSTRAKSPATTSASAAEFTIWTRPPIWSLFTAA